MSKRKGAGASNRMTREQLMGSLRQERQRAENAERLLEIERECREAWAAKCDQRTERLSIAESALAVEREAHQQQRAVAREARKVCGDRGADWDALFAAIAAMDAASDGR